LIIYPEALVDTVFAILHDTVTFSFIVFGKFAPIDGIGILFEAKELRLLDLLIVEHIALQLIVFVNILGIPPIEFFLVLLCS
jgi:hypothetical protein